MSRPRQDRLLAALIAKLPVQGGQWPREDRVTWLRMMAMAFDVVYGSCGAVGIAAVRSSEHMDEAEAAFADLLSPSAASVSSKSLESTSSSTDASRRFHVDPDGFAMADGKPITIDDLPPGAILWDERGAEAGDLSAILWRDIGTTRRGLPAGVTLMPAA